VGFPAQVLGASAGRSIRGRAGAPHMRLYHAQDDGVGTQGPTWTTPISETWTAA